ncbi:ECF transporter S component [bacterium]|nr:ECF transporter S component [bacterium]MBU1634364.1 ECF transporter S component [bacterium]MBU1900950.1 ECF transporter S component [Patescibacteria group bacterium]
MSITQIGRVPFKFQELSLRELRFYLFSALFTFGNIALPWLFHQLYLGGKIFLPIYFFILVGAYKYGWKVGLATALLSPIMNHLLTGMPPAPMLLFILVKGSLLGLAAALIAKKTKKLSIIHLLAAIVTYQLLGTLFEWFVLKNAQMALSDLLIGYPGLLLQLFGGYFVIRLLNRYV